MVEQNNEKEQVVYIISLAAATLIAIYLYKK